MRITLCGTGAGVNTALRANAGIVLQANERTIMLDCGGGSVREAVRAGIAIRSVEAVCLSHLHQDHCGPRDPIRGMHSATRPPIVDHPGNDEKIGYESGHHRHGHRWRT